MKGMKALIAAYVVLIGMVLYAAWDHYTVGYPLRAGFDLLLAFVNGWGAWRIYRKLAATQRCLRYMRMAGTRFVAEVRAGSGLTSLDDLSCLLRAAAYARYMATMGSLVARYGSLGHSGTIAAEIDAGYALWARYFKIYDMVSKG